MQPDQFHCSKNKGRPRSSNPLIFKTVGLTREQWDWLELWFPSGNPTDRLSSLLERATKFWPLGPFKFGHGSKSK